MSNVLVKREDHMKKLLTIIPLVFLLCFTFGCQKAEEVAEEVGVKAITDEDVAAIRATLDMYVQYGLSGDWDSWVTLFTEDTIIMLPNAPILQGREAYKEFMEAYPVITEITLPVVEVDGYGDLAFARGTYSVKIEMEGVPEPIQDRGKYLCILRKQEDGSWLIARDIYNSDLPLPTPPEKD